MAAKDRADGLLVVNDAMFSVNQSKIMELAANAASPASPEDADSPDEPDPYGPAMRGPTRPSWKKILGRKAGDSPIEQPTKLARDQPQDCQGSEAHDPQSILLSRRVIQETISNSEFSK
jgi:hypothetical protein